MGSVFLRAIGGALERPRSIAVRLHHRAGVTALAGRSIANNAEDTCERCTGIAGDDAHRTVFIQGDAAAHLAAGKILATEGQVANRQATEDGVALLGG